MLLYSSFRSGSPYTATTWSVQGYVSVFTDPETFKTFTNTLLLALARSAGAIALALFLAWALCRTDVPGRRWLERFIYFRFFVPPLPVIMAWTILLAPRSGLVNRFGTDFLGLNQPIFNVFSYEGIIFTGILSWTSFLYVFIAPAFQRMDMTLEESSRVSGAGQFTTFFRVTLPILSPAILATAIMALVRMLEAFESELFLGAPAGIYVFTTKIFRHLNSEPPLYPQAMALSTTLLFLTLALVVLQWKILGKRQFTTVTGKGYRPTPMALGKLRYLVLGVILFYLFLDFVLPLGALIYGSFMKIAGLPQLGYTLKHWAVALQEPMLLKSLKNTVIVASASAGLAVAISTLAAYLITRTNYKERRVVELVTWIPWAVPGLVLALGFLWAYILLPVPFTFYGTIWIIMLAFIVKGLPVGTRMASSSMVQIHKELEESSRVTGASWIKTFRHIWVPLLRPGLLGAWIILVAWAVRDLATVMFLYGPASRMLSTTIYDYWFAARIEEGLVYGVIMAALVFVLYAVATWRGVRTET